MTTYRLPPRGPTDLNVCQALVMLNDHVRYRLVEDEHRITFYHATTLREYPVDNETITAIIDGGYATWDDSGDVPEILVTESGRYQAQRFQKLNRL